MNKIQHPKKIGLLGPFGFGNLGDAAIQRSMIQHLQKQFPGAQIYGFSMNPADTEARHNIKAFPITRRPEKDFTKSDVLWKTKKLPGRIAGWFQYNPNPLIRKIERVVVRVPSEVFLALQAYRNLKGLDLLIFSGGGQLDDLWGGPWKHPYVLFKFALLARLRGIKVIFVSVGVESVHTFFGKIFVKTALGQASYKSFRDRWSKQFVEQNGLDPKKDSFVYPDLAHSLDIDALKTTRPLNSEKPGAPIVGVNIVPFYDPRFWPFKDPAVYQEYLQKMASIVGWLLEKSYRVKYLRSDIYPDIAASADMMATLKNMGFQYAPEQIMEPPIQTLDELVEELRDVDFVIASRLHSVLLAQRVIKPVIALSYQSKIDKLMEDTGQAKFCNSIDTFKAESIKEQFQMVEAECDTIKAQLSKKSLEYRTALDEQYERIYQLI